MKKLVIVLIIFFFLCVLTVYAGQTEEEPTTGTKKDAPATIELPEPISVNSVPELINKVINGVLGVVGSLALLMFIYGGFVWMLSGGNEQMVTRGKNTLMWAAAGLVIIFMSYVIVKFIIEKVGG